MSKRCCNKMVFGTKSLSEEIDANRRRRDGEELVCDGESIGLWWACPDCLC